MIRAFRSFTRGAAFVAVAVCLLALPARAADPVEIEAEETSGFGRLKFDWPQPVEVKQIVTNGVLVLTFDRPFDAELTDLPLEMPNYIALARQDGDGKTLRIALKFPFRIESLPAGREVYVNLVPEAWEGDMPGLPAAVVARLEEERRAREAAEAARRALALAQLPDVPVGVGVDVSYSRILFDWPERVDYNVSRDADRLSLTFSKPAHLKIQRLKIDPPPFVRSAEASTDEKNAKLMLEIAPEAEFRIFREDDQIVLDLTAANQDAGALATLALDRKHYAGTKPSDSAVPDNPVEVLKPAPGVVMPDGTVAPPLEGGQRSELADNLEAPAQPETPVAEAGPEPAEPAAPAEAAPDAEPEAVALTQTAEAAAPENRRPLPADEPPAPQRIAPPREDDAAQLIEPGAISKPTPPKIERVRSNSSGGSTASREQPTQTAEAPPEASAEVREEAAAEEHGGKVHAGETHQAETQETAETAQTSVYEAAEGVSEGIVRLARTNSGLRFSFPGLANRKAAIFERADHVWILFETPAVLQLPTLTGEHTPYVDLLEAVKTDGISGMRLRLSRNSLVTARVSPEGWEVSVGDAILEPPAPLDVQRGIRADGGGKLFISTEGAGEPHELRDPEVGDTLIVVPFDAPVRGVLTPRRSVDLEVLPTAHGLAMQPIADDVTVQTEPDEVTVTRSAGLVLTPNARRARVTAAPRPPEPGRSAFLDFGGEEVSQDYHVELARLNAEVAAAPTLAEKQRARMELARFYLRRELASEAMGVMRLVLDDDEEVATQPGFRALRGIGAYMIGRYDLADADLSVAALENDPNAAFWRVMARQKLGRAVEARPEIGRALSVVGDYPVRWQSKFQLAAAEVSLDLNDVASAEDNLLRIPLEEVDEGTYAETEYLQGRVAESSGDTEGALSHYSRAVALDYRPVSAKATLAETRLMYETGAITDEEAINTLDRLRFTWRGDETELATISQLAEIYAKDGDYRGALTVMRDAVTNFPLHEKGRAIAQQMGDLFRELYLEGKADDLKPLEALSLFYDFRELTPVGRDGDAMIRKLADRLVAVDLLDQAAEMLDHQVTHRLRGVARAQVAARLAAVQLLNHEPEEALTTLRKTRQSRLPDAVALERRLLEAQALSAMGRYDHARELIADDNAEAARALRADIQWSAGNYEDAGKALENLLGLRWTRDEPLSEPERFDVLRAAISYVLARDTAGVERIRQKFGEKMADGPQAAAFAIVASSADGRGVEFRDLAREIAQVDTLDRFMDSYRDRYADEMPQGDPEASEPEGPTAEGDADEATAIN